MCLFSRICISLLVVSGNLLALPQGSNVTVGNASCETGQNHLEIQSSNRAVIEWDQFSINQSESVHFQQTGINPSVLNRVHGGYESQIMGKLTSNGEVLLINPYGILIGPSAHIETAGFVASTLDVLDKNFIEERSRLYEGESKASIIHLGKIVADNGDVFFLAQRIQNEGSIAAKRVGLFSTNKVLIHPESTPHFFFEQEVEDKDTPITHQAMIKHSGIVEASFVENRGGEIYLVAEKGIELEGKVSAPGGQIEVMGETIHLLDETCIDISGGLKPGNLLVGGERGGVKRAIPNAQHIWCSPNAQVIAHGGEGGDGGCVIFWADQSNTFLGKVDISGGRLSGDGGFAEVSAPVLNYKGMVKGEAPHGKNGLLLLDPNDIVIGASATTGSFGACGPPSNYVITTGNPTNQILSTDLETQLGSCNVTISTVGSAGAGPNGGSISVSSAVTWATANTLTLTADSFIPITAAISNTSVSTGFDAIVFTANGNGGGSGSGITISNSVTAVGGNISMTGTGVGASTNRYGISLGGSVQTTSGNITLVGNGSPASTGSGRGMDLTGQIQTETGTMSITANGDGGGSSAVGLLISSGGSISSTGTSSPGTVTIIGNGSASGTSGNLGIGFNVGGTFSTVNADMNITGTGANSAVSGNTGVNVSSGTIQTTGTGTITIEGTGVGTSGCIGVSVVSATISANSSGSISVTGTSNGTSGSTCHGINISNSSISSTGAGNITLVGTGGTSSSILQNGIRVLNSPVGSSTMTGDISMTGTHRATAGNQGISVADVGSVIQTSSGNISLLGQVNATAGSSSYGVYFSASATAVSDSGNISITGTIDSAATASTLYGVYLATTNAILNNSGDITITGTSSPNGGSLCRGVYFAAAQDPGFSSGTPTLTITGVGGGTSTSCSGFHTDTTVSTGIGNLTFLNCSGGGSGASCHAINSSSSFSTTTGNFTVINAVAGTGDSSYGFRANQGITTTTGNIDITASSNGSGGSSYGIYMNSLASIYQTSSGNITLNGTGGASTTYGLLIQSTAAVQSTANGVIALNTTATTEPIGIGTSTISAATGSNITFGAPVVLLTTLPTISGGGAGTIAFNSTLDGISAGGQALSINASSGNITFTGAVGGTTRLGAMTLASNGAVSAAAITAASVTQTGSASGTYSGAINTNNPTGVALTGSSFSITGPITTTLAGDVTITNSGALTIGSAANMSLGGFFLQNGAGAVSLAADIALTLSIEDAPGDDITFSTPVTLADSVSLDSSAANGDIIFQSTVDGTTAGVENLTMDAGTGNISITGAVGATTRLGNFIVTSCTNLTTGSVSSATITQSAGLGTTTFGGTVNTTGNIDLTGAIFNFNGPTTTSGGGTVEVTNSGLLTIASGADMNLDGTFTQNGAGSASIGGNITTSNDAISFATPITLTAAVEINSGIGAGDITFSDTINGTFAFGVDAGTGSVVFAGVVGGVSAIDNLTVSGAAISISGSQSVQTGPVIYDGPVTLLATSTFTNSGASLVNFRDTVTGNFDMTVLATSGSLTVEGDLNLSGADGGTGAASGDLTCTTSGSIIFEGQVLAQGGEGTAGNGGNGGAVALTSTAGSIIVQNINTSGGIGTATGGDAGNITLTPTNTAPSDLPSGIIRLNADLGGSGNLVADKGTGATDGQGGIITLSASRSASTLVATIVSSLGGNNLTISGRRLVVGSNEAITALGDINFSVDDTITIGDVVALGDLTFSSGVSSILLLTHGNINILNSDGDTVISPSAHFIAGNNEPTITGTLTPSGPVDIQGLSLSSSTFRSSLLFGSTILNFDPDDIVPPTTQAPFIDTQGALRAQYQLIVADTELGVFLPVFSLDPYRFFVLEKEEKIGRETLIIPIDKEEKPEQVPTENAAVKNRV